MRFVFWYSSTTKGHWFGLFVVLISNAAGFAMLYYSGRSTKTETGEVLASDTDLNAKGLIEYWWDLLCAFPAPANPASFWPLFSY